MVRKFPIMADYDVELDQSGRLTGGRRVPKRCNVETKGLVSVITVCRNSAETIERTIDSIAGQSYRNVEYIVVDGGSTDRTLEILRERGDRIDVWVSERDAGISDAFNKGISIANGEFVILVNADDWLGPDHVGIAVDALSKNEAGFVFGDLLLHGPGGEFVGLLRGEAAYEDRVSHIMPFINHPTVVCRREVYVEHGLFCTSLHCAMDYEWLLRLVRGGCRGVYLPELESHMSLDGRSDRLFRKALAEVRDVSIAYGYPARMAWTRYIGRVVKGYVRRGLERVLPPRIQGRLRGRVNRNFTQTLVIAKRSASTGCS